MQAWKNGAHPEWLAALAAAELSEQIPVDVLCRIAFQECSWRPSVIFGKTPSSAGCLGMMQLNPLYFPGAGVDWSADVLTAANYLRLALYGRFKDWQIAVAAYNWGPTAMAHWLRAGSIIAQLPVETADYVRDVFSDVPVAGVLLPQLGSLNA